MEIGGSSFTTATSAFNHDGKTTKFAVNLHNLEMQSVLDVSGEKFVVLATVGLAPVGRNTEKMSR
jgi:hypothetical protein